uniref:BTB domain-containing protein n=1 Tax=Panagrolaimus sp. ES5 TaxID=591445 RepID=A0AC34FLS6_9BILA
MNIEKSESAVMESDAVEKRPFKGNDEEKESDAKKAKISDSIDGKEPNNASDSEEEEEEFDDEGTAKLFAIMSDDRFADVILVAANNVEIKSHRNILGYYANKLAKIFENSTEIPVRISAEEFEAVIVKAALKFLYGKTYAIRYKEKDVSNFAEKFEIKCLMEATNYEPENAKSAFSYWMRGKNNPKNCIPISAYRDAFQDLPDKNKWEKMAGDDRLRYEEEMKLYKRRKLIIEKISDS